MAEIHSESGKLSFDRGRMIALALLGLLLLLPGTAVLPLIDRDEPRFARATVEMMDRGEWIVPYFNNDYRFDKPVLTYWMMRVSYWVFGVNEFGARFHSMACLVALALVVFGLGRAWVGTQQAFWAAVATLVTAQFLIHGRSTVADMPMVLFVAVSQFGLFRLLTDPAAPPRWFWITWLSLGLGFLAKGPIAWLVPALSLVFYRWVFRRKPVEWKRLRFWAGLPVALSLLAAWGIPALLQTRGEFWEVGMHKHVIQRGFEAFDGRRFVPFFYLPSSLISLFPWAAFAGFAWYAARREWSDRTAFLVSWLAAPYLIFTLYSTQLPHYVMPAYPAYLLLLSMALSPDPAPARRWPRALAGAVLGIGALLAALLAAALLLVPPGPMRGDIRAALGGAAVILLGLLLCASFFGGIRAVEAGRAGRRGAPPYLPLFAVGLFLAASGAWLLGAGLRELTPAVRLVPAFRGMPANAEFLACSFREPSLVFYSGRPWTVTGTPAEAAAFAARPGPRMIVLLEEKTDLDDMLKALAAQWRGRAPSKPATRSYVAENDALGLSGFDTQVVEGYNVARSAWVKLRVLIRK